MDSTGLLVTAAVLLLGTAAGIWHRRTDGRLRTVSPSTPASAPPTQLSPTPSLTSAASTSSAPDISASATVASVSVAAVDGGAQGERLDSALLAQLGVQPAAATLLQFSSAFCAPCRAVRRISSEVADLLPGVRHVEVDAESHLDAVRALGIWRTPTLLVLDADGRVMKRATGVPAKPQLIAVLAEILH